MAEAPQSGRAVNSGARRTSVFWRGAILFAFLCLQIVLLHVPYSLKHRSPLDLEATKPFQAFAESLVGGAGILVLAIALFFTACWPKREILVRQWREAVASYAWHIRAGVSFSAFAAVLVAVYGLKTSGLSWLTPMWLLVAPWSIGVVIMLSAMILAIAPISFWKDLIGKQPFESLIAVVAVTVIWALATLSQDSWSGLSMATLEFSRWILSRYEAPIIYDAGRHIIGTEGFWVEISPQCSGYAGIGLVEGFLALYLIVFRRYLKFPNALLLIPIGALTIWVLNSVRIALLVTIGAHISQKIATHGFHSQAGWIMFLVVTIGIMALAHRAPFIRAAGSRSVRAHDPTLRLALALIMPFATLMATGIVQTAFETDSQWLYVLRAVATAGVLLMFWDIYAKIIEQVSLEAVLAGIGIGIVWVFTDPHVGIGNQTDTWVNSLSLVAAIGWLSVRILGFIVLTPIAEELLFRGYLHRALVARNFETATVGQFSWPAFLITTTLFAGLHTRWLAAAMAGAIYAILMYRKKRLADPIVAHVMSNAVIAIVAVATGQWSLL